MKFRAAVVLGMLAMGCGSEEPEFTVVFEETYGECERDCHGSLRVSADGKATASLADSANSAARTRSFTLTAGELEALKADVETARGAPWDDVYGCPDCADQGQYTLELESDGASRKTAVDPMRQPEHLAPLLNRLDALLDANEP